MGPIEQLREELVRRQQRNPRYSLRAFARATGVSPATMSQVLSGKRSLTLRTARNIIQRLPWDESSRRRFLNSLVDSISAEEPT